MCPNLVSVADNHSIVPIPIPTDLQKVSNLSHYRLNPVPYITVPIPEHVYMYE